MALQNALGELNLESTQQETLDTLATLLMMIIEKMPRVDGNDRLIVSHAESNPAVTVSSGTVTTVSNVATMTAMGSTARPADAIPLNMSTMAASIIYNGIVVS